MAFNGSTPSLLPPNDSGSSSLSSSQLLSASMASSTSSRHGSSQISKIYRQSSTLFLTRRLPESLSTILPVITAPTTTDSNGNTSVVDQAPIAKSSRTTRIKVWSLYLTILNAIVELDGEEGKAAFGTQEWRNLVTKVRDGIVWEEVVQNGYRGIEGDVDADVVINLATLLLAHARTQHLNQQRLEAYLAAARTPNLDLTGRFSESSVRGASPTRSVGTDTPRDLNARVKILELYTLHVLLRNDEWAYARDFISASEVLDEERRDAFLAALQSLEDEREEAAQREQDLAREKEEKLQADLEEARRRRIESEEREARRLEEQRSARAGSEVDYGVDSSHPVQSNGSANGKASHTNGSASGKSSPSKSAAPRKGAIKSRVVHPTRPSGSTQPATTPPNMITRATALMGNVQKLIKVLAATLLNNPGSVLRTIAFAILILLALGNRQVKDRLRGMWDKVRGTMGMATKVSYI
ncbi:hypothetical protein V495_08690 [Pseudogymnoascus sp. VKM F-4514 (FW-929)]|nr:hypothetical protein V490_08438 [Pseudogymnoascus sp. VKM F-3557]KFY32833.1 hypothetical protein V495_08690 [Pseudogymnoascus sp. VKM F-4514 (FW-929)]KFY58249.1 hypothetical protein V497_04966 [Pseudogymnoascus sp. VKM F-4516 (FW-969)]